MMFSPKSKRGLPVSAAIVAAFSVFALQSAFGQNQEADVVVLEGYEVTGSRITGAAIEGSLSVSVFKLDDIATTGFSNFGELLRKRMSQFGGGIGTINEAFGNGGSGQATISLRNLPLSRTLFLINGRRTNADINLIPNIAIDRIEILNDGASPIYGTDAVSGVVNVILKRGYDGAMLNARYANTFETDVGEQRYGALWGGQAGKTSITIAVEHSSRNIQFHKDRQVSLPSGDSVSGTSNPGLFTPVATSAQRIANNATISTDAGHAAGVTNVNVLVPLRWFNDKEGTGLTSPTGLASIFTTAGSLPAGSIGPGYARFLVLPASMSVTNRNNARNAEEIRLNGVLGASHPVQYGPNKVILPGLNPGMPFGYFTYAFRPQEANSVSITTDSEINDKLTFFLDLLVARNESANALAASPLSGRTIPVSTVNGLNLNYWVQQVFPGATNAFGYAYRPLELGPRITFNKFEDVTLTAGFKGKVNDWNWQVSFARDEWKLNQTQTGGVLSSVYNTVLAGTTATTAFNPFGFTPLFGTESPVNPQSMIETFSGAAVEVNRYVTTMVEASISGEIMDLSHGPLSAAFSFSYQRDQQNDMPDNNLQNGLIFPFNIASPFAGSRENKGYSAEFNVPILEQLSLSIAGRLEDFSDVGRTGIKPRVAFRWEPIKDELTIRGSWAQGFSAPSIAALDASSPFQSFTELFNPVTGIRTQATAGSIFVGNPVLQPAESDSYLVGVVYSPKAVKGLTVGMNYYRIEESNIPFTSDQYIVNEWFAAGPTNANNPFGPNAGPSAQNPLGSQVELNVDGSLLQLRNIGPINTGARVTDGIDVFGSYLYSNNLGDWSWDISATKVLSFEMENFPGSGPIDYLDGYWPGGSALGNYGFPVWKGSTALSWKKGSVSASLGYNYVDGYKEKGNNDNPIDSYDTADIRMGYLFNWRNLGLQVTAGVNNVFDEQPPFVSTSFEAQSDRAITDIRGRMAFVEVSRKW